MKRYLLPLLALSLAPLAGCSGHPEEARAPASPAYVAVARGRVDVEGGLLRLASPRDGTVLEVPVHEGDQVRRGQVLARLDPTGSRLRVGEAEAALHQLQAQATEARVHAVAARRRADRLQAAVRADAGDRQSADDARAEADGLRARAGVIAADIELARQKLAAARHELDLHTLRAPRDARVVRVMVQPGSTVAAHGEPLFELLPAAPPIVRAELSEAYAGAVHPGMPATVAADGGHGGPWRARVLRVGSLVGPSQLDDDPQQRANERTLDCVLAFLPDQTPPRVGQRVLVRFGAKAR